MREILFRGKSKETDEWIYGHLNLRMAGYYIKSFTNVKSYLSHECKIDDNTVGQFTGLRNSYGQMIYEGDILDVVTYYNSTAQAKVIFTGGSFQIELLTGESMNDYLKNHLYAKVIGNIYD